MSMPTPVGSGPARADVSAEKEAGSDVLRSLTLLPDGWVRRYVEYASSCTDAPSIYHVACGLAAISTVISPILDLSVAEVRHPLHIWVLLLGRSSEERKSTAVDLTEDVITKSARLDGREPSAWRLPESASPEAFLRTLDQRAKVFHRAHGVLIQREFKLLLGQSASSYWRGMRALWPRIYDGRDFEKARGPKEGEKSETGLIYETIKEPRVTLIGASEEGIFASGSDDEDWKGGFYARIMMFPARRSRDFAFQQGDPVLERQLVSELLQIRDGACDGSFGILTLNAAALLLHRKELANLAGRRPPPIISRMYARAPEQALRVAALLELARAPLSRLVRPAMIEAAWRIVRESLRRTERLVCRLGIADDSGAEIVRDQRDRDAEARRNAVWKLLHRLRNGEDEVIWSDALKRSHLAHNVFSTVIDHLQEINAVKVWTAQVGKSGRPGKYISILLPENTLGPLDAEE